MEQSKTGLEVVKPSKEHSIAEAFYDSTSFYELHRLMRQIHGTHYRMTIAEHRKCYRTLIMNDINNPKALLSAYELLVQKKLQQPFSVRYFIARLFNMEKS